MKNHVSTVIVALCVGTQFAPAFAAGSVPLQSVAPINAQLSPPVIEHVYRNDTAPCHSNIDYAPNDEQHLCADAVKSGAVILLVSKSASTRVGTVQVLAVPRGDVSVRMTPLPSAQNVAALPARSSAATKSLPMVDPNILSSRPWRENVIGSNPAAPKSPTPLPTPRPTGFHFDPPSYSIVPDKSYVYSPNSNGVQCFVVRFIVGGSSVDSKPAC